MQVPLNVFNHDDGVVNHQTDGENDSEQRQQVDGKTGDQHEEDGADER